MLQIIEDNIPNVQVFKKNDKDFLFFSFSVNKIFNAKRNIFFKMTLKILWTSKYIYVHLFFYFSISHQKLKRGDYIK